MDIAMARLVRFGALPQENHYYDFGKNETNLLNTSCPDGVQWLYKMLGECDVNLQERISAYLGLISILLWVCVVVPQIIKNFRNIDGMAGISFLLLFNWTTGDLTNLIGCFLTHQLMSQTILGFYFVVSDCVLVFQYMYYFFRRRKNILSKQDSTGSTTPKLILCFMGLFVVSHTLFGLSDQSSSDLGATLTSGHHLSRTLLSTTGPLMEQPDVINSNSNRPVFGLLSQFTNEHTVDAGSGTVFWHSTTNILGYSIGIVSAIFYVGSRLSQIVKNITSQSTEGLSMFTFILAVFGNLFYGLQILVRSQDADFLIQHTPWLVGSLGVIALDVTLLVQFRYYSNKNRNLDEIRRALLTQEYHIHGSSTSPLETATSSRDYGGSFI